MIRFGTFFLLFFSLATASAQERIDLWEGIPMPNTRGVEVADSIANHRVYKVGRPALYRVAPTPENNRGIAMVICPGGGHAISLETQPAGTELWKELTERWIDLLYGPKNETSKR